MRWYIMYVLILAGTHLTNAQAPQSTGPNLVANGAFEEGNAGFNSSYLYSSEKTLPGYYSVTNDASFLNKDFKDPIGGDHTPDGHGMYMVVNSDGLAGEKVWCSMVQVLPNSMYNFSMYFCNIYRLLPPKTNFAFEDGDVKGNDPQVKVTIGTEVLVIERDFFHMFKWLEASATWYSGEHSGPVRICIENLNASNRGNDLAIDDISLFYVETKPAGYKHPDKITSIMHMDYTAPPVAKRKIPLSDYGNFDMSDTLNNGVVSIKYKKPEHVKKDTLLAEKRIERVQLKTLMFAQGKPDLLPQSKQELDLIAEWLNRDTDVRIRFIGHTDNQGDSTLNVKLSEQRVLKVKEYMITKGITADRIETVGYGGKFPIADNSKEETRKQNRRVEMEILK